MAEHGRYSLLLPRTATSAPPLFGGRGGGFFASPSSSSSSSVAGRMVALKIHSQAEKRRRERINTHLSTLRRMIPDANKMDKASLLARVVDQMKYLKRKAIDVSKGFSIPTEADEVTVAECQQGADGCSSSGNRILYIKASICCDDRPDLFSEITQAFNGLKLKTISADMTSLGGRMRNVFVLCCKEGNGGVCLSSLKESITVALSRVTSLDMDSQTPFSGKRQRFMQSQCFDMSI